MKETITADQTAMLSAFGVEPHGDVQEWGNYTLAQLLDFLPKKISEGEHSYQLRIRFDEGPCEGGPVVDYSDWLGGEETLGGWWYPELVDSLYEAIKWCIKNNYIIPRRK